MGGGDTPGALVSEKVCARILEYIRKNNISGAHLNELARSLQAEASRVTILDRLIRLEENGVLESRMERSEYGEDRVQKWTRKYRITPAFL